MGLFGFTSVADAFDGGGAGRSGPTSSFEGTSFDSDGKNNYVAPKPGSAGSSGGNNILSTIGSLVGLAVGGPGGAAIGAGLGSLIGGGSIGNALKAGAGTYVMGAMGGNAGVIVDALQGGRNSQAIFGGAPQGGAAQVGPDGQPVQAPPQNFFGGITQMLDNPLIAAAILQATEPKNVSVTTQQQRDQLATGERNTGYQGTAAPDFRYQGLARGGIVQGPGTGTSDSIRAKIYQNGRPVREARLSDGEFVMTNKAVRGAGGGDRAKGAAEMYRMMRQFERRV